MHPIKIKNKIGTLLNSELKGIVALSILKVLIFF